MSSSLKSAILDVMDRQGPESFLCPLSMEIMRDPVFTRDGHCYERSTIEGWLRSNDTSPLTGNKLEDKSLVAAIALRKCIEEWRESMVRSIPFSSLRIADEIGRGHAKVAHRAVLDGENVAAVEILDKSKCTNFAIKILAWVKIPTHPRLTQVLGVSLDTSRELLVTEYAPLGTLPEAIQLIGKVPITHKTVILQQVCAGMEALIAMGLLHKDLALRSVLAFHYDSDDAAATSVKLVNLGVSDFDATRAAPEILRGLAVTERSDVWSFGVLAWELLADGRRPYGTAIGSEVTKRVLAGERPCRIRACPESVWNAVASCWAETPLDRPTFRRLSMALGYESAEGSVDSASPAVASVSGTASGTCDLGIVGQNYEVKPGTGSNAGGWSFLIRWMITRKYVHQANDHIVKGTEVSPRANPRAPLAKSLNIREQTEGNKPARRRTGSRGRRADSEPSLISHQHKDALGIGSCWHYRRWSAYLPTRLDKAFASVRLHWYHYIGMVVMLMLTVHLLMREDEIKNLIAVLNTPRQHKDVLVSACHLLSAAADRLKTVDRKKGIEAVITLLKGPGMPEAVLEAASESLSILAEESEGKKVILQAGGVRVIINLLKRPVLSTAVLEAACRAFGVITEDVESAILAGQEGGIQAVIGVLRRSAGHLEGAQLVALLTLRNLMRDYENIEAAKLAGGYEQVVNIIQNLGASQAVLEAACRVLGAMSMDIESANAAGHEGALKAVFDLLKRPGVSETVLEAAFGAATFLIQVDSMKVVRQVGGIQTVIRLINRSGLSEAILEASCATLGTMVLDLENAKLAALEGGFHALVRLLRTPGIVEPILESACGALGNMAEEIDQKKEAGLAGGVQAVIGLLKQSSLSEVVLEAALGALGTMTVEIGNAKLAGSEGGVDVIIGILQRSVGSEGLTLVTLGVMRNLLQDVQNIHTVRNSGGVEAVVDLLRKADPSDPVLNVGCEALMKLSEDIHNAKEAWYGALKDVLETVCTALD